MEENKSYCDGCKYITWMITPSSNIKIGGGCNHPVVLKRMDHRTTFAGVPKEKPQWCAGKQHGKVMHIDTLANKCGYFIWNSPVNNGYGCNHPKQEDLEEFEGKEHGRCMRCSCPIAFPLSPNEEPEDREYFDCDDWQNMSDGDWMLVFGKFKSGLDTEGKKFVDDTMKLVEENKDLEIALSKVGSDIGGDDGGCGSLIAQEVLDYIEGYCPHRHRKCSYWKEISDDVFSCTHKEDNNTICPLEKDSKDSKDNEIKEMN